MSRASEIDVDASRKCLFAGRLSGRGHASGKWEGGGKERKIGGKDRVGTCRQLYRSSEIKPSESFSSG